MMNRLLSLGLSVVLTVLSAENAGAKDAPAIAPVPAPTAAPAAPPAFSQAEILKWLKKSSTGNISDAVDQAAGRPGFLRNGFRPLYKSKIIGPAATTLMRPLAKNEAAPQENFALQLLDEAGKGSVLVFVLEGGFDIAAMGNLMATTAKVRGLAGAVIDGGVRDIDEIEQIGLPVWARNITPATLIGRLVSVAKQVPVTAGGVLINPGDIIVADVTGVVAIPKAKLNEVVALLRDYDAKESKMVPIIKETKSMLKALAKYNRY